jgi:hypothetical protein
VISERHPSAGRAEKNRTYGLLISGLYV